jgi:L-fuconolactonase
VTDRVRRIDAHHHLWDLSTGGYDWPTAAETPIYRSFSPEDLWPELLSAAVDATVLVQTVDTLDDTDAMIRARAANPWIAGIVGWVPLTDVRTATREIEARLGRGLRGIRHLIHRVPDVDWLLRPDVHEGLALLESLELAFDVVAVFPDHLRHVPAIADQHPGLTIVIDHLAKPPIRDAGWDLWRRELEAAALRPNVVAKVSGLDTAAGPGWTADEILPSVEVALEAFGPSRLLFGSDWPVCQLVSSYGQVVDATQRWLAALSPHERDAVLGANAERVYRLSAAAPGGAATASP